MPAVTVMSDALVKRIDETINSRGATVAEVAELAGCSTSSVYNFTKLHPERVTTTQVDGQQLLRRVRPAKSQTVEISRTIVTPNGVTAHLDKVTAYVVQLQTENAELRGTIAAIRNLLEK